MFYDVDITLIDFSSGLWHSLLSPLSFVSIKGIINDDDDDNDFNKDNDDNTYNTDDDDEGCRR